MKITIKKMLRSALGLLLTLALVLACVSIPAFASAAGPDDMEAVFGELLRERSPMHEHDDLPRMPDECGVLIPTEEEILFYNLGRPIFGAEEDAAGDIDNDGIPDAWEMYGADFNGDGIIDLPLHLMGADPYVPDIFVEVDWMEGRREATSYSYDATNTYTTFQQAFDRTAKEFEEHGIRLHIDFGPGSIDYVTKQPWDSYPGGAGGNSFPVTSEILYQSGVTTAGWDAYSKEHLSYLRIPVFHHCLVVPSANAPGVGGVAWVQGMGLLITAARSFMHELGHNLGLGHGGRVNGVYDSVNYKPNYISRMNYGFTPLNDFLFSETILPDLDEGNLSEPDGIDPGRLSPAGQAGMSFFYRNGAKIAVPSVAGVALDYNGNGVTTDTGVVMDINNDGQLGILKGAKDWGNMVLTNYAKGSLSGLQIRTITYNANGGTGAPDSQQKLKGQSIQLRLGVPAHDRMTFQGWTTVSGGSVEYQPGDSFSDELTENITLYAVWEPKPGEYRYTLDKNNPTATFNGPFMDGTVSGAVTLTTALPACPGTDKKDFLGWAESATATLPDYVPGEEMHLTQNKTLYGVWAAPVNVAANSTALLDFAYPGQIRWVHLGTGWSGDNWRFTLQSSATMSVDFARVSGTSTVGSSYSALPIGNYSGNLNAFGALSATTEYWLKLTATPANTTFSPVAVSIADVSRKLISFWANGGSGAPDSVLKTDDVTLTLPTQEPVRPGYRFLGWGTSATATSPTYMAGGSYTANTATRLFAVWIPEVPGEYLLTLDKNLATASFTGTTAQFTSNGGEIVLMATLPACSGADKKDFLGWSESPTATAAQFLPGDDLQLTKDTVLYGVWATPVAVVANGIATLDFAYPNQIRWVHLGTGWSGPNWVFTLQNITLMPTQYAIVENNMTGGLQWTSTGLSNSSANLDQPSNGFSINSATNYWIKLTANTTNTALISPVVFSIADTSRKLISFWPNGGTGAPDSVLKTDNVALTLPTQEPVRPGYRFLGWHTSATATTATYAAGGSFTLNSNTRLYAVWQLIITPTITSANSAAVVTGAGGTFQVTATGDAPISYSLSGAPAGVTINSATGLISITGAVAANTYTFTITASNGTQPDATQSFTLMVSAKPLPSVTWPTGLEATYGQTLSALSLEWFTANHGGTPGVFTWTTPGNPVGDVGTRQHNMTFTPTDAASFATVSQNVNIEVKAVSITSASVTVTAPVVAMAPNSAGGGTGNFTVGAVTWTPADNPFKGNTQYTARVTLTASANYTFTGLTTATINGYAATATSNTGGTVILSYQFAATAAATVTGITIVDQPAKLAYYAGDALALAGLSARLTYNDGTQETIAFADFASKNISTAPANGTVLVLTHNGTPVMVSRGGFSANTSALTVNPALAAPSIAGPAALTLTAGYAATSSNAFTVTGNPAPTVTKTAGDAKITWNNATKKLDIASGLAAGTYPVTLKAGNGMGTDAAITFTLTVNPATAAPSITGPATLTLTAGYAATSSNAFTVTGNPAPTVTKTAGDAKITWNNATKKLDIASGLAAGTYPVTLKAGNGVGTDAAITFTLTVNPATVKFDQPSYTVRYRSTQQVSASGTGLTYTSSNPSRIQIDPGRITSVKSGFSFSKAASATITVSDGKSTDTASVKVTMAWWQWMIIIVLFGWIWY